MASPSYAKVVKVSRRGSLASSFGVKSFALEPNKSTISSSSVLTNKLMSSDDDDDDDDDNDDDDNVFKGGYRPQNTSKDFYDNDEGIVTGSPLSEDKHDKKDNGDHNVSSEQPVITAGGNTVLAKNFQQVSNESADLSPSLHYQSIAGYEHVGQTVSTIKTLEKPIQPELTSSQSPPLTIR